MQSFWFKAKDSSGNRVYIFVTYPEPQSEATHADPGAFNWGIPHLKLRSGEAVNKIGPRSYRAVISGMVFTSDDPNAV